MQTGDLVISSMELKLRRIVRWGLTLGEFGLVQGLVQAFTAASGLIIVRALSKHDYALFAVANGMQSACNLLADLGIGIGVTSIGGRVWHDRLRFGELLNTAFALRLRFALLSASVCLPVAMWMFLRNGAMLWTALALCAAMVAAVIPQLGASIWQVSAQLHSEYRRLQKLDLGNAALRCVIISLLAISRINAVLAVAVGVASNWIQSMFLRRWAGEKAAPGASVRADDRRELLTIAARSLPNTIFFCFQTQITLLILTALGNTTGIADVTALGRVAALLGIFSITFANVLAPSFARCQEPARLKRLYILLTGGSALVVGVLFSFAKLFPDIFLSLLGSKYLSLKAESSWVVAAYCVSQVAGVMWGLNCAKAWIRVQSMAFIPTVLAVQAVAAVCLDLRHFHDVLVFNLVTAAAPIPLYLADALLGLRRERASAE